MKTASYIVVSLVLALLPAGNICRAQQYTHYDSLIITEDDSPILTSFDNDKTETSDKIVFDRRLKKIRVRETMDPVAGYKCGFVNSSDSIVIPLLYDNAYDFQDDSLAIVHVDNKPGVSPSYYSWYIKLDGTPLFPDYKKFCDAWPFHNGYAIVDLDGNYHRCHINKKGQRLYPQTYILVYDYNEKGRAVVAKSVNTATNQVLYAVIDTQGHELAYAYGTFRDPMPFPKVIEDMMK